VWLVAAELFFEGVLTPFLSAALVLGAAYFRAQRQAPAFVPASAIALSVVTASLVAFGWPVDWVLTARTKILVSAVIGLALGALFEKGVPGSRLVTTLGLIGVAVWISEPALRQNRWEDVLPLIPLITGVLLLTPSRRIPDRTGKARLIATLIFAFGLAAIAALAKALSYSLLTLALASAGLAVLMIGRSHFPPSAAIAAYATLLALATALVLYTDISLPALLILCLSIGAERLSRLTTRHGGSPAFPFLLAFCIATTLLAIVIARIDGGAISIY
jgi:hypothetical protein